MAKWAFITTIFYILLVILFLIPSAWWLADTIAGKGSNFTEFFDGWNHWLWWVATGVIVLLQALLLLFPVSRAKERPKPQRALWISIIVAGILFSLLLLGVFASASAAIWGDDQKHPSAVIFWAVFIPMSWFIWAFIFYRFAKTTNADGFMIRTLKWLITGSIVELLVAVPCHVIVRHKNVCCAQGLTFYGIAAGLAVMALAFGPGIAFFILKRVRNLKPKIENANNADTKSNLFTLPKITATIILLIFLVYIVFIIYQYNHGSKEELPSGVASFNNHCYKVFPYRLSWEEAQQACEKMGGSLACITTPEENNFILNLAGKISFSEHTCLWIGGRKNPSTSTWEWITGESLDMQDHLVVEDKHELYLNLRLQSGLWEDYPLGGEQVGQQGFVCEWSSLKLLTKDMQFNPPMPVKRESSDLKEISIGKPFPELVFNDLNGTLINISNLKGKVVLIDFWATWCGPCKREIPGLVELYNQYHNKGFEIIGISLDSDINALKKFLTSNHVIWPQYFDGKGWDNEIASRFGIESIPSTVLLDKEGNVIRRCLNGEILRETIEKLLTNPTSQNNEESTLSAAVCSQRDLTRLAIHGKDLTAKDAEKLEEQLRHEPNDLVTRAKLLGFYSFQSRTSDQAKEPYSQHVFWLIENKPDSKILGSPFAELDRRIDGQVYLQAKNLWFQQINKDPNNTMVIGNAAHFFLLNDSKLAESLLKKAQSLEPNNPEWPQSLAHLYSLRTSNQTLSNQSENAKKSLEQMEKSMELVSSEIDKYYMLSDLAKFAYQAGDSNKAENYAKELLLLAPKYPGDWNYGNAIHHANIVLGRIALARGNIEAAKEYLIEAGKTPGSPQLNSFGPNMTLAKELLEKKETQTVLSYFELCGKFWKMGGEELKEWSELVRNGEMPDFGGNLLY
jgi:thiol-disulfide isomerase/thioredoxin/tetratricopeptide (TPR) repeat protein